MLSPIYLSSICVASVVALLVADRFELQLGRFVAKLTASTSFVLVAVSLGAHTSTYGIFILGALFLSWLGDALLLSNATKAFMGGLAAFLLSHVSFAIAFAHGALSTNAMLTAAVLALMVGTLVLRWLLPSTPSEFKGPVLAYVVVILVMCITAAGHAFATQDWMVLCGAVLFAASDISVARDRFVKPGYINRLWGWPAYFSAQIILALSIASCASHACPI